MDVAALIRSLEWFGGLLPGAVAGLSEYDAGCKPPSGAWSVLEIVCHLADEEAEDFRTRLRLTLEDASLEWPALDPEGAARDRSYNERNLSKEVERFVNERRTSLVWLKSLESPNWEHAYVHPKWGSISAGTLLASWAAHDLLHLRQIAKRRYELACRDGHPYLTDYAGPWGA